jgi:hypothetical protein
MMDRAEAWFLSSILDAARDNPEIRDRFFSTFGLRTNSHCTLPRVARANARSGADPRVLR